MSKWEKGLSSPDAEMVVSIAKVLGVSAAELIAGDAAKIHENEAEIERLSKINEQLINSGRRMRTRNRRAFATLTALLVLAAVVFAMFAVREHQKKGYRVSGTEHLGSLTYRIPEGFRHSENDVGVTVETDGICRISAKLYRNYEDMAEIRIGEEGEFDPKRIEEFRNQYPYSKEIRHLSTAELPDETVFLIAATDGGPGEDGYYRNGSYYRAFFVLSGRMYRIEILNGKDVLRRGEFVVSQMAADETQSDEFWDR